MEPYACDVRVKGLEPPRITPPDPKSGAAANYAIPALDCKGMIFPAICKVVESCRWGRCVFASVFCYICRVLNRQL